MKNILIIGSKGMAGHMVRQVLIESDLFKITDISRSADSSFCLDLTDLSGLADVLSSERPDVVINCAGILNDAAESDPEKSIFINSLIPHFLARRCKRLIHISTDCVFSGLKGDYTENDLKDGQGFYAESKSLGEVLYEPHVTLRTSIIGPELKADGRGLLHWFLNQAGAIKGYSEALWSGVTTLQLTEAIIDLINKPEITGLIHYTNNKKISKLDLLNLIALVFKKEIVIQPFEDYHVDKSLVNTRHDFKFDIPDYEYMIKALQVFMEKHRADLYEQYYTK